MAEVIEIRSAAMASNGTSLDALPEVEKIECDGEVVRIYVKSAARALAFIAGALQESGDEVDSLEVYRVSLERVFMHVTGKALRD